MKRFCVLLLSLIAVTLSAGTDPWKPTDLLEPSQAARNIQTPLVIHVGFSVLYRAAHITGSTYAGPGSETKGIEDLKKAVQGQPRTREILLYCGCCPFDKCPNIRPAYSALHELGYTNVKVIHIPTNLKADWIDQNFPTQKRVQSSQ